MKIRWTKHPHKPELNGTTQHVSRETANHAVDYGEAVICPLPRYGTEEWVRDRQFLDSQRRPHPDDVDPNVIGVEWGIHDSDGKPVIIKRERAERWIYATPPADCPAAICAKFLARNLPKLDPEAARELEEQRRIRQSQEQKENERKGLAALLFGK